jgi:DNA-binding SARP family transcriptional activator/TolB-like protein
MGTSVGTGVETDAIASGPAARPGDEGARLRLRLLGPLSVEREGVALTLPGSRKVRALIAYLALAPRPVGRSRLCELLWDLPNDPRGELRWCLSKMRRVLDEPGRRRVGTHDDGIALELSDGFVDVLEVGRAIQQGLARLAAERLRALAALFAGDFLEGLELDRSPEFSGWLAAQRGRLRAWRTAVLEALVARAPVDADEVFGHLEQLLQLAPFDRRAHAMLLDALAARGRLHEGDAHLAATTRLFEAEGLDAAPLHAHWRRMRSRGTGDAGQDGRAAAWLVPSPLGAAAEGGAAPSGAEQEAVHAPPYRASIAVMPFAERGDEANSRLADGLAHDVVTRLAKLRHLFVIAYGTTSALDARGLGTEEAGRLLNVDYVAGGTLRREGGRLSVTVELAEARSARIVWADAFEHRLDDALEVLDEIGDRIVASIEGEIELAERNRAILKPPNSLNAWEAYHRGLWHMYRYEPQHNRLAGQFFERAARLDPSWARALAALSFTHFQNAFQRWTEREHEIDLAFGTAEQSLIADDRDPSAHWAMGRALWLRHHHEQSLAELQRAVELSPSFAHGHYTLAFVHAQSGDPGFGIERADHSRRLSPFDPLLCAMLATRAMALVRLGRFDEAADWAVQAANRPNTFSHLRAIAAACLGLAGRCDEGREMAAALHRTLPHYRLDDLLATFQFAPDAAELFRRGARLSALS